MNHRPLTKGAIAGGIAGLIASFLVVSLGTFPDNPYPFIESISAETTENAQEKQELWVAITALQTSQTVLMDRLDDLVGKGNLESRLPLNGFASKGDLDALKRDMENRSKKTRLDDMKAGVTDALKEIQLDEVISDAKKGNQQYLDSIETRAEALAEILNLDDYQYEELRMSFRERAMRGATIIELIASGATPEDIQIASKKSQQTFWSSAEEFLSTGQIKILRKTEP